MKKEGEKLLFGIAFTEIFLLVIATFSFALIIGELPLISAGDTGGGTDTGSKSAGSIFSVFGEAFDGELFAETTTNAEGVIEVEKLKGGVVQGTFQGHLISALLYAGVAGLATYFIADALGASEDQSQAAAYAVALGTGIARFGFLQARVAEAGGEALFGEFFKGLGFANSGHALLWGVGIAAVTFVLLYKEESKKVVQFQCLPWEAPLGGQNCERCNEGDLPCSEYRCRSLGQACQLINVGSEEERCVWVQKEDVSSATITPSQEFLTDGHIYTNHETRPPSLGTKITRPGVANGCIKPFTPLKFGFVTNEAAQCKIGTVSGESYEQMQFFVGENNLFIENHTQSMNLPSPDSIANLSGEEFILGKDGRYDFFVKCIDANGNANEDAFLFSFCVDPTPDTTPPVVVDTSIISGSPVSFGANNVSIELYTNEPAECKWSILDKAFADMENTMSCSTEIYEQNARLLYTCASELTGVKDRELNSFYFRCKDQPGKPENERNVNTESYPFSLMGSQELNVMSVAPNGSLFGSTQFVQVELQAETSNGVNEGQSTCYFSDTNEEGSFIPMFETDSHTHRQLLSLPSGDYSYNIRCVDLGGNSDSVNTSFSVFTDSQAPFITRIYKEGSDALKIITSEKAECTYSLNNCNFAIGEGIAMQMTDPEKMTSHFAKWDSGSIYYVKCRDQYGNQPNTNLCSVIVSASSLL